MWPGQSFTVAHIPEHSIYGDVLKYKNDVLGIKELNEHLDGYHDHEALAADQKIAQFRADAKVAIIQKHRAAKQKSGNND